MRDLTKKVKIKYLHRAGICSKSFQILHYIHLITKYIYCVITCFLHHNKINNQLNFNECKF